MTIVSFAGRAWMEHLAYHLALKLHDERVIAQDTSSRRILARTVIRNASRQRLIAFRAADTHLHLLVACSRLEAGQCARRIEIALRRALRLPVRFAPASVWPILDQTHLVRSFFYVLRQEKRHGLVSDPFHDASNLPDLLGLRLLGRSTAEEVRAVLPRIARRELLDILDHDTCAEIRSHSPLPDAASAAAALPDLAGRSEEAQAARRAAAQVAADVLPPGELADLLGVSDRTLRRILASPPIDDLASAVEMQLRMRQ